MSLLTRRAVLRSGAALVAFGAGTRAGVAAARAPLTLEVADTAVAAIVAAVAGTPVSIAAGGEIGHVTVNGTPHPALGKIVLKGTGAARVRFLDDPRNAPSFGAAVRDLLAELDPAGATGYADRHKAWSRPFARQVLKWSTRLATSSVAGKTIRDPHGRTYLLEWAGATLGGQGQAPPAALAKVGAAPSKGTLASYTSYIESLVAALG